MPTQTEIMLAIKARNDAAAALTQLKTQLDQIAASLKSNQTASQASGQAASELAAAHAKVATGAKEVGTALGNAGSSGQNAFQQLLSKTSGLTSAFSTIKGALSSITGFAAVLGVALTFDKAIQQALAYDNALVKVRTTTNASAAEVTQLKSVVDGLGEVTTQSSEDLVGGFTIARKAGLDTAQSIDVMKASAELADARFGDLSSSAGLVAKAVAVFGDEGVDASKAADLIASTVKNSNLQLDDMSGQFERLLPIAKGAGATLQDVLSTAAALSRTGEPPRQVIQSLTLAMEGLAKNNKTASQALIGTGLTMKGITDDIQKNGLLDALLKLNKAFTDAKGNSVEGLTKFFGGNAQLATAVSSIGHNPEIARQAASQVANTAAGTAAEAAATANASATGQYNLAQKELNESLKDFGTAVLPLVTDALKAFAVILSGIGPVINALALALGPGVLVAGFLAAKNAISETAGTIAIARGAWASLSAVLVANPIIAVSAAVIGLGAALIEVTGGFEQFSDNASLLWSVLTKGYEQTKKDFLAAKEAKADLAVPTSVAITPGKFSGVTKSGNEPGNYRSATADITEYLAKLQQEIAISGEASEKRKIDQQVEQFTNQEKQKGITLNESELGQIRQKITLLQQAQATQAATESTDKILKNQAIELANTGQLTEAKKIQVLYEQKLAEFTEQGVKGATALAKALAESQKALDLAAFDAATAKQLQSMQQQLDVAGKLGAEKQLALMYEQEYTKALEAGKTVAEASAAAQSIADKQRQINEADYKTNFDQRIKDMEFTGSLQGQSNDYIQRATALHQEEQKAIQAGVKDVQGYVDAYASVYDKLHDSKGALDEFTKNIKSNADEMKDIYATAFGGIGDSLKNFVHTGTFSLQSLTTKVQDLVFDQAWSRLAGAIQGTGGQGGGLGSLFGGIFGSSGGAGGAGGTTTGAGGGAGGLLGSLFGSATGKPDGTQTNPLYVAMTTAAGALGSTGTGGLLGSLFGKGAANEEVPSSVDITPGLFGSGGTGSGSSGALGFLSSLFRFGGIMTPQGPLALNKYESGGVALGPQMAIFGEGRQPEAYVPLPDGRRIPVRMDHGAAQSSPPMQMVNNYTIQTPDANSFMAAQSQITANASRQLTRAQRRNN